MPLIKLVEDHDRDVSPILPIGVRSMTPPDANG